MVVKGAPSTVSDGKEPPHMEMEMWIIDWTSWMKRRM